MRKEIGAPELLSRCATQAFVYPLPPNPTYLRTASFSAAAVACSRDSSCSRRLSSCIRKAEGFHESCFAAQQERLQHSYKQRLVRSSIAIWTDSRSWCCSAMFKHLPVTGAFHLACLPRASLTCLLAAESASFSFWYSSALERFRSLI